ncbi:MAG: hypothetical protein FP814_02355 [Desulfobacterium sp.]|nr:hypothetical protein [Desulfobacterium sp.]MBU3949285.1 DUF2071 domain-containing protein [Pseudomonadota bacterium]MBU4009928.1 DUF2071 domain-containing protein [Pseudomonadota bacterium]MBU4035675.1 DUF2071 domain-containing protein [Pseudomonadota bacterium]
MAIVRMNLHNVFYISYLVPAARIRSLVPKALKLASDENNKVYVSFVAMKCLRARFSVFPLIKLSYYQLNLRTYVSDPKTGDAAVYFFNSGVSLGIIPVLTRFIGIAWEKISFNVSKDYKGRYHATGYWLGEFSFEIDIAPSKKLNDAEALHITGPMMGFIGPEGKTQGFRINHQALKVYPAVLNNIEFPLPLDNGLVTSKELHDPDSVLVVPEAEFMISLPPAKVDNH